MLPLCPARQQYLHLRFFHETLSIVACTLLHITFTSLTNVCKFEEKASRFVVSISLNVLPYL